MIKNKNGTAIILLIGLIIIALVISGGLFVLLQKERSMNVNLQQQLEEVKLKQKDTEVRLGKSQEMIAAFEIKLKEAEVKIDTISSDLENEKSSKQDALNQVETFKAELVQQKELRVNIESKLAKAEEDIKKSQDQLAELSAKKSELEVKIKNLEIKSSDLEAKVKGIELGTIVVAPQAVKKEMKSEKETAKELKDMKAQEKAKKAAEDKVEKAAEKAEKAKAKKEAKTVTKKVEQPPVAPTPEISTTTQQEGSIAVVNKDYNFAVINLGNNAGVKLGAVYSVFHNNSYIGDVKVEKVHESMSAAGFVNEDLKDKITEGDKVVEKK
jgi:chromosome segregation ATPase